MPDENKALVASSEFDPSIFIAGIDQMTAALDVLSKKEDEVRGKLKTVNDGLAANRKEMKATEDQIKALDKASATYATDLKKLQDNQVALRTSQKDLRDQMATQKTALNEVNVSANNYKAALQGITAVTRQVQQENKGKTIFDVASLNQQVQQMTAIGGKLKDIFKGKIDNSEIEKLESDLAAAGDQFQELATVIDFVEQKLGTLDPNSQEFADLTKVIETGKEVLDEYGKVVEQTGKKSGSLRSQLTGIRDELAKMEQAGEEGTQKFEDLSTEAARLEDQIGRTQQRIRVLASDTRNLDFGIGALRGVAAAFSLAEGSAALFGLKNEDVMESIQRLNAIMAILNGLQEIQTLLQKQSVVMIVGQNIATKAYIISQRILAATLGTTAAASRGLALALAATGIGAIVIAIVGLITIMSQWGDETKEMIEAQEMLNFAIDLGEKSTRGYIAAIGDANKLIVAGTEARQAANEKVGQSDLQLLRQRQKNAQELRDVDIQTLRDQLKTAQDFENSIRADYEKAADTLKDIVAKKDNDRAELLEPLQKTIDAFNKAQETRFALEDALNIKSLNNLRDNSKDRNDLQKLELAATEDFGKRLDELKKRLLDGQNKQQIQNAAQLKKQATDNLKVELKNIDRDVRKGVLTEDRGNVLKGLLKQINSVELETELKEFRKKSVDAARNIENEIFNLRLETGKQRAELIRDQLTREAAIIAETTEAQSSQLETERNAQLKGIQDAADLGLISPASAEKNRQDILLIYQQLLDLILEKSTRATEALAATAFELAQNELTRTFAFANVYITEAATQEIIKITAQYRAGNISYEKYQQELTRINREESTKRVNDQIKENEALLDGVQARILAEQDPDRLKALLDKEAALRESISGLKRQAASGQAEDEKAADDEGNTRLGRIAKYAVAINAVVEQVVQFWQAANEAEQRSLEKSIALQERRVEAATRIAERGNAEYLRLEEDRLNELQVKQENAARRQLAINAVLQTSQALTAFITALAQGIATGGPLGGIAIAAAVIGLIASGYAIIQSLNADNTPRLFKGKKYVTRDGNPAGIDTIPALLTEGEAIVPRDKNKNYHPAVAAIIDGAVPAEEMNRFVNSYRNNRRHMPGLDYDRMNDAAAVVVSYDSRMLEATKEQNRLTAENNHLLRDVKRTLGSMGISATVDKNGLAISLMKVVDQTRIDKKT